MLGIQTSLSHPIIAVPPLLFLKSIHLQGPPHHHIMVEDFLINHQPSAPIQITITLYQTLATIPGTTMASTVRHRVPPPVQTASLHSTLPHPMNSVPILLIPTPQSYQALQCRPSAPLAMPFPLLLLVPFREALNPLARIPVVRGFWVRSCSSMVARVGSYYFLHHSFPFIPNSPADAGHSPFGVSSSKSLSQAMKWQLPIPSTMASKLTFGFQAEPRICGGPHIL